MLRGFTDRGSAFIREAFGAVRRGARDLLRPPLGVTLGFAADMCRSREQLMGENALLRQQLIVAQRHVKRPQLRSYERAIMVGLAAVTSGWQNAVLLVKPDTVLRWHREGFRLFWRRRSRTSKKIARIPEETVELIRRLSLENRLWGAERVRGELLKLGVQVSKKTILKYMRRARGPCPWGQSWSTFLRNHMHQAWACDFLQLYDLWFRPIFAFFIIELGSRRVVHVAVTRNPTATWTAQQLREVTPFGTGPRFLIRDNDDKYSTEFDDVAEGAGTRVLRTAVRAPRMNAHCERFLGSVRRDCLDHVLILHERHLQNVLDEYCHRYFGKVRPHQGIGQLVPVGSSDAAVGDGEVVALPVLGGLHHEYRRAA